MTEREIKVILSENEYMALIMTFCRYQMSKIQVNYYFDTDELLMNKNGITCRIRLKDGIYKATVKCRSKDDPK